MSRRDAMILRAASVWTIWIWGTRISNILSDETRSRGFKLVHVLLALVSIVFAIAILVIARKNRRGQGATA